jgi:hypothetical protein
VRAKKTINEGINASNRNDERELKSIDGVRIWKIRRWFRHIVRREPMAISFPKIIGVVAGVGALGAVFFICVLAGLYYLFPGVYIPMILVSTILGFFLLVFCLHAFRVIIIRKDCYECPLGFFVVEHEKNHLRLNLSGRGTDETIVAEETMKQNRKKLDDVLRKNPEICKNCLFKSYANNQRIK